MPMSFENLQYVSVQASHQSSNRIPCRNRAENEGRCCTCSEGFAQKEHGNKHLDVKALRLTIQSQLDFVVVL